jgi:hypothetical protein
MFARAWLYGCMGEATALGVMFHTQSDIGVSKSRLLLCACDYDKIRMLLWVKGKW